LLFFLLSLATTFLNTHLSPFPPFSTTTHTHTHTHTVAD
jgi:hypothetical protein